MTSPSEPVKVPSIVLELASKVNMIPLAWAVHPDKVVIVFEHGQKMIFDRDLETEKKPISVSIQKLPTRKGRVK